MKKPQTLYFNMTGPLIEFDGEFLRVEDLNPHVQTRWRMSRRELFVTGLRFIFAAVRG